MTRKERSPNAVTVKLKDTQFNFVLEDGRKMEEMLLLLECCEENRWDQVCFILCVFEGCCSAVKGKNGIRVVVVVVIVDDDVQWGELIRPGLILLLTGLLLLLLLTGLLFGGVCVCVVSC